MKKNIHALNEEDANPNRPDIRFKDFKPIVFIVLSGFLLLGFLTIAILSIIGSRDTNRIMHATNPEEITSFTIDAQEISNTKTITGFQNSYTDWEGFFWNRPQYDEEHSIQIITKKGKILSFTLYVRHEYQDVLIKSGFYKDHVSKLLYNWLLEYENQISPNN